MGRQTLDLRGRAGRRDDRHAPRLVDELGVPPGDDDERLRDLLWETRFTQVLHGPPGWLPALGTRQLLGITVTGGEIEAVALDKRAVTGVHVDAAGIRLARLAQRVIGPDPSWFGPPVDPARGAAGARRHGGPGALPPAAAAIRGGGAPWRPRGGGRPRRPPGHGLGPGALGGVAGPRGRLGVRAPGRRALTGGRSGSSAITARRQAPPAYRGARSAVRDREQRGAEAGHVHLDAPGRGHPGPDRARRATAARTRRCAPSSSRS